MALRKVMPISEEESCTAGKIALSRDNLAWLELQVEWGADEALLDEPQNRVLKEPGVIKQARSAMQVSQRARPAADASASAQSVAESCRTLDDLRAALDAFDACALKRTATQLVFADGAQDARVMIVGEAPGAEEDRKGLPFVGPAGHLLDRMLASIGLDRGLVRIVNVVPWRPPGNRTPSDTEISLCLPFLHRHISLIRPELLVLLGATAVKALIGGREGISRLRGKWQKIDIPGTEAPIRGIPSYHPAYLLRQPAGKRLAWMDMLALREAMEQARLPMR